MKQFPINLKNPNKEYRAIPFWSWNDRLDPEFLRWQIREMDRAGLGGYFMHARGGLRTEYMGADWMNCIKACLEEGNSLGMSSWCYDEEGWPSGFAGGKVPAMGIGYQVKWLEMERISYDSLKANMEIPQAGNGSDANGLPHIGGFILGIYRLEASGELFCLNHAESSLDAESVTEADKDAAFEKLHFKKDACLKDTCEIFVIRQKSSPYYLDILNKDAVKAFIDCTHDEYHKRFGEHFGNGMPGFFTDEPQYSVQGIPWSHVIPEAFRQKHGYDILDVLPALFVECRGYQQTRYDFWSVVSSLYVESFGKQIYEWCENHHCTLTGHVMMEDTLYSQMVSTAGAMPFYEYMQIPGMDWLGRLIDNPVVPRQVSSVANQLGKPFILSEMFALCGWNVSFEELKWIAEWQYVNGVNLMCQHLEGYTLEGARKRDYPPSMFYQQPWWEEYKNFNDYFARLGMLLADGINACDVLLLHPIRSGWIAYNHSNTPALQKLNKDFIHATQMLSGLHIDHHYGDETIMEGHGWVQGGRLTVGQCSYHIVIMPSMMTIDEYTLKLLNEFTDHGGILISIGDFPGLVGGRENSSALAMLKKKTTCIGENEIELYALLKDSGVNLLSISCNSRVGAAECIAKNTPHENSRTSAQCGEIRSIHSRVINFDGSRAYFMVNHSQGETYHAVVEIGEIAPTAKLNLETGAVEKIDFRQNDGKTTIELEFLPMQSHVIVTGKAAVTRSSGSIAPLSDAGIGMPSDDTTGVPWGNETGKPTHGITCLPSGSMEKDAETVTPQKEWYIEAANLNSLTLDYCSYRINHGDWQEPVPVIHLMDILLNLRESCNVEMKFCFEARLDLEKNQEFLLAVESADKLTITVNDSRIEYTDVGWWKDSAFKKINIKPFVKIGRNEIILERHFYQSRKVYDVLFGENILETEKNKLTYDTELESIYVIGDFGVVSKGGYTEGEKKALFTDGPFVIVDQPERVANGQLTQQGFCFFAGSIKLSQNLCVKLGEDHRNAENIGNLNRKGKNDENTGNDTNYKNIKKRILLDIGKPDAPVSKLFINGQPVKTLMWAPYTIDITEFVHDGDNKMTLQLFAGNRNLLGPHHHRKGELYFVAPHDFSGEAVWQNGMDSDTWRDRYCFVRFGV
ncbi:MAG: glycosyl hydrolase [Clostridiaceae bacterium]